MLGLKSIIIFEMFMDYYSCKIYSTIVEISSSNWRSGIKDTRDSDLIFALLLNKEYVRNH